MLPGGVGRAGLLAGLLLLCLGLSLATLDEQPLSGSDAAEALAAELVAGPDAPVLIVGRPAEGDRAFVAALEVRLRDAGRTVAGTVTGGPPEVRAALEAAVPGAIVAATREAGAWPVLAGRDLRVPPTRRYPTFLKRDNLLNVANQIVVIAILAVGMTLVILTGGIDLSVGSLIALAAVTCPLVIRQLGGTAAGPAGMFAGAAAAIAACALCGLANGWLITRFRLPPFIATLGMMQVASGAAYLLSRGQSVYDVPESFVWLGRGADLLDIPNAVLLMAALYAVAHLGTTRTRLGRRIYAVGGNREAARLSGVPVARVIQFVYLASAALAGLGGVIMASQLRSGAPTYGGMYELFVIAAVVVGGTSLNGGSGSIAGTLVGAFLIAVIQNGMNLVGLESYTQKVVLGLVILGAVLLDPSRRKAGG